MEKNIKTNRKYRDMQAVIFRNWSSKNMTKRKFNMTVLHYPYNFVLFSIQPKLFIFVFILKRAYSIGMKYVLVLETKSKILILTLYVSWIFLNIKLQCTKIRKQ